MMNANCGLRNIPNADCRLRIVDFKSEINNEHGTALVITMFMLVLLSILGVFALATSTTDLRITGNVRRADEALYAAERGIEYGSTASTIYDSIGTGSQTITTGGDLQVGSSDATVTVTYINSGNPPLGSGSDPTYFQANYFVIPATGTGPMSSEKVVESQVAKVVPK